ncbi:MAG TPA: plastocyanin/azurin family copper-binding protein [Thermoleophilaceae bacterium]
MGRALAAAVSLVVAGTLVLALAAGAGGASRKTVRLGDNYYTPPKLTVSKGTTIVWKWPSDTGDTHDVTLGKRPKGVKKFQSELASIDYSYKRTLKVPGRYYIYCSLHDDMRQTITVKR